MRCRELANLLVDYVAGELSPELAEHIKEHLGLCPPCVRYVETYEVTIKLTRQLPMVALPPEILQRLREAIAQVDCDEKAEGEKA
ncbi:MAG: zf-HC2 domain-containing protein [Gemmataceae bacterium]